MKTKLFFLLTVPLFSMLFTLNSCSKDDDENDGNDNESLYISKGDLIGTTSKNQDVYLHINEQSKIDSIAVKIKINFVTYYCTYIFHCATDIAVDKTTRQFEAKLTNSFIFICGESDYPVINGTFEDDDKCSGTISVFEQCGGYCGSYMSFGSGSTVAEQTWSVERAN